MALVSLNGLLAAAEAGGFAVPAFSILSLNMLRGVMEAAEAAGSPVILQISPSQRHLAPFEMLLPGLVQAAKDSRLPVVVQLDHCCDLSEIEKGVCLGLSSAMFDGSGLPFGENLVATRSVAEYLHSKGCSCEAELGGVGGNEGEGPDRTVSKTSLEEAVLFARESGTDALAVAIGNVHGNYRGKPELDMDLLSSIRERSPIPLVLHGGSGLSDEDFLECIARGIRKINISTALKEAELRGCRKGFVKGEEGDFAVASREAVKAIRFEARHHIDLFGCADRSVLA